MIRRLFFLFCALFCIVSCTTASPARIPPVATISELSRATVALGEYGWEGEAHPYCSGVWISGSEILTAAHCVLDDDVQAKSVLYFMSENGLSRRALVTRVDKKADLALLTDLFAPLHNSVPIASFAPRQGEEVHVFGHLRGFWWTYLHGYVASSDRAYETMLGIDGPFLQIQAPIAPGSSGGGAFNAYGELIGICSWTRRDVPAEGFFIHTNTIRRFLR